MRIASLPWVLVLAVATLLAAPVAAQDDSAEDATADAAEESALEEGAADEAAAEEDPAAESGEENGDESGAAGAFAKDVWSLDLEFEKLRSFSPKEGPGAGKVYWYMLYTLENHNGKDVDFYLSIAGSSDRGKKYHDIYLPSVERAIERYIGEDRWGQADRFEILRKRKPEAPRYNYTTIRAGEARKCIAVMGELDSDASTIEVEVRGLSSDLETAKSEDGADEVRENVRVLTFKRLGDEYEIVEDPLKPKLSQWVKKAVRAEPASGN